MPCFIVLVFTVPHRCYVFFLQNQRQDSPPAKDYNLLCCHTCFNAVVWDQKCHISVVFLHFEHFSITVNTNYFVMLVAAERGLHTI